MEPHRKKTLGERLSYVFFPKEKKGTTFYDRLILQMLGAEDAWTPRPGNLQEEQLIRMTVDLSQKMGIEHPPQILIYQSSKPNAASLASGKIVFGTNLLDILSLDEVKAVIAHELAHHRHMARDWTVRLATTAAAVVGLTAVSKAYRKSVAKSASKNRQSIFEWHRESGEKLPIPVSSGVLMGDVAVLLGADVIGKAHQRTLEYEADKESGIYTGHPRDMIGALQNLEKRIEQIKGQHAIKGESVTEVPPGAQVKMGRPIDEQHPSWIKRVGKSIGSLFADHPSFDKRIERLEQLEAEQQAAGNRAVR